MKGFAISKNRISKAHKIETILNDYLKTDITGFNILDIGTGDGIISSYFAEKNPVTCVDIVDQRHVKKASFVKVDSSTLPFESSTFDIVISNHTIEHIENQTKHIQEIERVLKTGAIFYFATPNWNFPIEPHYKIPLIHYLPNSAFNFILKKLKKYKENLFLLSYKEMKYFCEGFKTIEYTGKVLKTPSKYYMKRSFLSVLPENILTKMSTIAPTNIFILIKEK